MDAVLVGKGDRRVEEGERLRRAAVEILEEGRAALSQPDLGGRAGFKIALVIQNDVAVELHRDVKAADLHDGRFLRLRAFEDFGPLFAAGDGGEEKRDGKDRAEYADESF